MQRADLPQGQLHDMNIWISDTSGYISQTIIFLFLKVHVIFKKLFHIVQEKLIEGPLLTDSGASAPGSSPTCQETSGLIFV